MIHNVIIYKKSILLVVSFYIIKKESYALKFYDILVCLDVFYCIILYDAKNI